uniref:Putative defensin 2 n=1 Tax=Nyssomyia neivai TaxID=330878 RepID=A0A1L8E2S8_9DIPT
MRVLLISFAVVAIVGLANAYPSVPVELEEDQQQDSNIYELEDPTLDPSLTEAEIHSRQKRATCDLLSTFGVGHAACAAHCLGHGYRGGYCDSKAICRCRN